ncbi:MAG TPA: hypothetical protein VM010_08495 [Chitinophagaceae bacterium]|nr:hypothetical protein [Chitinophagaceae bacterium]
MLKKYTIPFTLATLLLVVFETIFLQELFSGKRTLILVVSLLAVLLASLFFALFYSKYRKAIKDS